MIRCKKLFIFFFSDDKLDRMSSRVLTELENIDDEAENKDIVMVKVDIDLDDKHILEKLGIPNNLPKLALFEEDQPAQLFEGTCAFIIRYLLEVTLLKKMVC